MRIEYNPIGVIRTPLKSLEGMPIQPSGAAGVKGTVEVFAEYRDGLKDLDGFSHIVLLYHFHRSKGFKLHVVPFMDSQVRGLFATLNLYLHYGYGASPKSAITTIKSSGSLGRKGPCDL